MRQRRFPASAGNWENPAGTSLESGLRRSDLHPRRNSRQEKPLPVAHIFSPAPPASDIPPCMARTIWPRNSPPGACLYVSPPVSDSPLNRSTEARHFALQRSFPHQFSMSRVLLSVQVVAQRDPDVARRVLPQSTGTQGKKSPLLNKPFV